MRSHFLKGLVVSLAAVCAPVIADQIEYSVYYFGDNANNTVATSAFSLAKTLWQRTMVLLDVELDQTTVPPLDGVTGASRPPRNSKSPFRKNRGQIIGGVEQGLGDNTRLVGSYYFSQEVDYQSQAFIGGISQDLAQKNFTISLLGQYTVDSVGEILTDGSILNRYKETHQASLSVSQLLSPTSVLRMGADAMRIHGFQSDPYRKVVIPTSTPLVMDTITERHPSMRYRQAAWGEISKYVADIDGAFIVNYRYYWDDWGLKSHTATFTFNKYITKDWILSPNYRYYDQVGAEYSDYAHGGTEVYDASDYKLKTFGSNGAGVGLTCFLRTFGRNHPDWDFLTNSSVSVLYNRYFNDLAGSAFSANLLETRIRFSF
ncbi:MAG: hypothetical protein JWP91_1187 [Fibrobacteres bacterium]|nr:hypothetical protein [Fibrobacterota bacterium]